MSHKRKSTASDVETQPVTSTANVSASSPETQVVVTAKLSVVVKTLTGKSVSVDVVASSSDSTPTVDDLRNAIVNSADIGIMSEGAPIRMICNGRQLDTCFASLASCNITNGSVVHLIIRLGGNPCSIRLEDKQEFSLSIMDSKGSVARDWDLQDRERCFIQFCPCERHTHPKFPKPVLHLLDYIKWTVSQDCYCLSQETFNKRTIAVWRVDNFENGVAAPYELKDMNLDILKATVGYDIQYGDPKRHNCDVYIRPPQHGWTQNGMYELRLNAASHLLGPSIWDLYDWMPDASTSFFHITGHGGKQVRNTCYSNSLALPFMVSQYSKDQYVTAVQQALSIDVGAVSSFAAAQQYPLVSMIVGFLFFASA